MTSRERRLNSLYTDFMKNSNIAEYYQIVDSTFLVERINFSTFHFHSTYEKKVTLNMNLPDEIIEYIKTFIIKKKESRFEIIYPMDYPFKGPIWKLLETTENIKEYNKMIQIKNYSYEIEWSPAITFEKDILYMIENLVKIIN